MSVPTAPGRDVIGEIRRAFSGTPEPEPGNLTPRTEVRDRESEQVSRDFTGRHWDELDVAFLRSHPVSLLLLSPAAFHYFLPAYLIAAVSEPVESDLVTDAALMALTPPESGDADAWAWFNDRVGLLSAWQRDAARHWLAYLAAERAAEFPDDKPARLLASYWG
jgi:hypothetical protein